MKIKAEKYYDNDTKNFRQLYAQRVQTIFDWWGNGETVEVKVEGQWELWYYTDEIFIDTSYRTKPVEPRVYYLLISHVQEIVFNNEDELHEYADSNDIHQDDYEVIKVKEVTDK